MVIRGQLAFDDQGRLVAIDPDADDPTDPSEEDIVPVPFDELTAESVSTGTLENGVAGDGNTINDVAGDTDQFIPLTIVPLVSITESTISSTSFSQVGADDDYVYGSGDFTGFFDLQNAGGQTYWAAVTGRVGVADQDVTIRLESNESTEITVSQGTNFTSPEGSFNLNNIPRLQAKLEAQTGSDTAALIRLGVIMGKKIGQ